MPPGAVEVGRGNSRQNLCALVGGDLQSAYVHDVIRIAHPSRQRALCTQIVDVVAFGEVAAPHQVAMSINRAVAGLADAPGGQREVGQVGRQAGLERGDQFAAPGQVVGYLARQALVERYGVGQDQQAVAVPIGLAVDNIELVAALLQHAHGCDGLGGQALAGELLEGEDADVGEGAGAAAPRLLAGNLAVDRADEVVGSLVEPSGGVELIADRAFGVECQHLEALELQSLFVLIGLEVAPGGVELAGHAEAVVAGGAGVALRQGEVHIAPAAGGQRLQLPVAVGVAGGALAGADVAGVVEDGGVLAVGAHVCRHGPFEAVGHFLAEGLPRGFAGRVDALRQHLLPAGGAGAVLVLDDVEEEAVHCRQQREHFIDVRQEEVDVRSVQAELGIEAGLVGPLALNRAVGRNLQPLRLVLRGVVVPLYGGIDRQADVAGVGGFDLLGQ